MACRGRATLGDCNEIGDVLPFQDSRQPVHDLRHALHVLRDRVRNVNLELFFQCEKDVYSLERIDPQLAES